MAAMRHDVTIEKLVAGGDGLARVEGQVVFVPFTLPGEEVRLELASRRRSYAAGEVRQVLRASPHRVEPPCPVFGTCGGCAWQHIDYAEQLRLKTALAAEALARVGRLRPEELPPAWTGGGGAGGPLPAASVPYGYRNRVRLHRDGRGRLGYLRRGSHEVVPVRGCPIAVPAINAFLAAAPARPPAGRPMVAPGKDRFQLFGYEDRVAVEGEAAAEPLRVTVLDRPIEFQVETFFQSNLGLLPRLVSAAVRGLSGRRALDLYSGVGLFASFLADSFEQVIAVEENPLSLSYARRNVPAARSGAGHRFHAARVEAWLRAYPAGEEPDAALVDPPRAGLSAEVVRLLIERRPRRLSYVSCDVATLARDLGRLLAGGYRLGELELFDFYPQTAHLEAVARLERSD